MRYALVNTTTGFVENVVEIEPDDGSVAPDGYQFVQSDRASINDTWDGKQIVKAVPQEVIRDDASAAIAIGQPTDTIATLRKDLDALAARVAALEDE